MQTDVLALAKVTVNPLFEVASSGVAPAPGAMEVGALKVMV